MKSQSWCFTTRPSSAISAGDARPIGILHLAGRKAKDGRGTMAYRVWYFHAFQSGRNAGGSAAGF